MPAFPVRTAAFAAAVKQSLAQVDVKVAEGMYAFQQFFGFFITHVYQPAAAGALHVHVVVTVFTADNLVSGLGTASFGKAGYSTFFDKFRHKSVDSAFSRCVFKSRISLHFFYNFVDGKSPFCVAFKEIY